MGDGKIGETKGGPETAIFKIKFSNLWALLLTLPPPFEPNLARHCRPIVYSFMPNIIAIRIYYYTGYYHT